MDELNYIEAIILGIIQGLTEFLPISSSGHLVIAEEMMDLQQDSPQMLAFTVVSHLGTLLAVLVVFRKSIANLIRKPKYAPRILSLACIACALTAVVALPFKDQLENLFTNLPLVAAAMIVTGILLFAVDRLPRPRQGWRQFTLLAAALVGLAQAMAIIPGLSRSGTTICCAMMLGLRRRWAAEFSFLIAAPAISGVTIIKLKDLLDTPLGEGGSYGFGPLVLGGMIAALVGYFALILLLKLLRQAKLHYFSYYLWGLAAIMIMTTWFRQQT